jgi:IS5 family transposase
VNDQLSLWDAIVPSELLVLPDELVRADRLLDDPAFFARSCRTSTRVSVVPT